MAISQADMDREFAMLEVAAANGERCPQSDPHGPFKVGVTSALARAGKIRIEIYAHNWRVAQILVGPHKGKRTKATPYKGKGRPYKIIDTETQHDTAMTRRAISLAHVAALPDRHD